MNSISEKIHELNEMFVQGKALEAFDKFYADDVVMQENEQEPTVGKEANRKREEEFFGKVTEVRKAEPLRVAIGVGCTMVEWHFDYTHEEWGIRSYKQISVQEWKDGRIVNEKFYYGSERSYLCLRKCFKQKIVGQKLSFGSLSESFSCRMEHKSC